ncbi:LysR family transcriptional regulator [Streptomyces roseirectus]|uniref:LysR family transcriptional regulator n=1 Tax=Streptomyces roseirectus TaxID=2768066 RepID=UPI001FE610E1|nr:LysR family transcriptional regulator [Streptomyces roseirectus]
MAYRSPPDLRELECFLTLAEELHFGRTGERMYVSQARVSQLLRALERRIGGRLVSRTSRRVALTPLGERFLARLRPAYEELVAAVEEAGGTGLRLGFQGAVSTELAGVLRELGDIDLVELPLSDPFGALRAGSVDAAVVLLPVREPDLVLGPVFSRRPQRLGVPAGHPFATRTSVSAPEVAAQPLVRPAPPAPAYWRAAQAPAASGPEAGTLQEGLTLVATGRGAMLLCEPTATAHRRDDVVFVPVEGVAESALGLVWTRGGEGAGVRALARALAERAQGHPNVARGTCPVER